MIANKYRFVANEVNAGVRTLLDVGCRDGVLASYIAPGIRYTGVDLMPGWRVNEVCNIEQGLPFGDSSFDAVTALDVLEHTDDVWYVFEELARVARKRLFVVLPNMFWWKHRMAHLFGRESEKYRLPPERIQDRHRWLTSYRAAHEFGAAMARRCRLRVSETLIAGGRRTLPIDAALSLVSKNLGSWAVMQVFEKGENG